jgi:sterol desaturase/sphingolipid hydroxylase (fatty acid hydroxylase superfamily)
VLSLVTTWPYLHKVHHSRRPEQTNTNYGNLFSWWDRLFGTYTPSHEGLEICYGLDDLDRPEIQTTAGLLALPFQPIFAMTSSANRRSPSRLSASER